MSKRHSKFLSYVLRHDPAQLDLELDRAGWVHVDDLVAAASRRDDSWTRDLLNRVVETNDKKRFEFSPDGTMIRARQGHSIDVDLGYETRVPPALLFHGTVKKHLESIFETGLLPMSRHHVHLSPDVATASNVGSRRGKAVILRVDAARMHEAGHEFMCTDNDVWLVEAVPAEYIEVDS